MKAEKILIVCLNPTFQSTMVFESFKEGEVNRSGEHFVIPSGKGINIAYVLGQLHKECAVLTHIGGAGTGQFLSLCERDGINLISFDDVPPIRTCTTVINREKGTCTELVEEPFAVSPEAEEKVKELFLSSLPDFDMVVITGTKAPGYSAELYPWMVKEAKRAGRFVILDLKGDDLMNSLEFSPDIIKPNLSELSATLLNKTVWESEDTQDMKEEITALLKSLRDRFHTSSIISRGGYPLWVYSLSGLEEFPICKVDAVNTIGCGDALTAGLAFSLAGGKSLQDSVPFALKCAAQNAGSLRHGLSDLEELFVD